MKEFLVDVLRELKLDLAQKQALLGHGDDLVKLTCSLVGMQQSRSKRENSVPRLTRVLFVGTHSDGTLSELTVEYIPKHLPRYEDGTSLYDRVKDGEPWLVWEKKPVEVLEVNADSWPELSDAVLQVTELSNEARLAKVIEIIETAHGPQDFVEDSIGRCAVRLQDLKFDPEDTPVSCRFKLVFFHREVSITPYASFELMAGYSHEIEDDWRTTFGLELFAPHEQAWHDLFVREGCVAMGDITAEQVAPLLEQALTLETEQQLGHVEALPSPQGAQRDEDLAIVDNILKQYAPLPVVFEIPNAILIELIPSGALLFSSRQTVQVEQIRIETGVDAKRGPFVQVESLLDWDMSELTVVLHGDKRDLFESRLKAIGMILPRQDVSLILKRAP